MSRPPPPAPKRPGKAQVECFKALYDYNAQQKDELSFKEGEILYILDKSDPGWWKARVGDREGLIPSNYVAENTETVEHILHESAKRGNIGALQDGLNAKVSVNGLDKTGSTPLHWAASGGHADCVRLLLAQPGIMIDVQARVVEWSLLFYAI
eukprot:Colp12_sorted_trinity150504_noHs@31508